MSYAADLPRQLILFLFSLFLPLNFVRYLWQFLMLLIGPVGAYFLIKKVVFENKSQAVFAFMGGLFYLLNLGTLQNFYAPQSLFTTQYGFLPWLLVTGLLYVKKSKLKYLTQ